MTIEGVVACLPTLRKLAQAKTKKQRLEILNKSKSCIFYAISDISKNILNNNIKIDEKTKRKLKPYKGDLRTLARKSKVPLKQRKQIVITSGGAFLPALLWPAISYLGGKVADKLMG